MQTGNISKVAMAQRMVTSRSQLDCVLDPENLSIQLYTLAIAAHLGKTFALHLPPSDSCQVARTTTGTKIVDSRINTSEIPSIPTE